VAGPRATSHAGASFLALIAPHLPPALEQIDVPAYVIDSEGRIRWLNDAARRIVGHAEGRLFTSVLDPSEVARAREQFHHNLRGEKHGDFAVDVYSPEGAATTVEISSVALSDGHRAIGMFGIARLRTAGMEARAPRIDGRLTVRQQQILVQLADGASTEQIAHHLHLSRETVRNHVRHILQRLGVSSRLEAVAVARRDELV
jgi:PAS domain S-box-containing protein